MSLEIKLSQSWLIIENEYSPSGVILVHRVKSKTSSKVREDRTFHPDVPRALNYYTRFVIAKKQDKVKTVRGYIDEYNEIFKDGVDKIEEAIKAQDTDK